ncbi:MAG: DUF5677 domain-containing protein [Candidatus Paceibacterota bacterium]
MERKDLINKLQEIIDLSTKSISSQENLNNDAKDLYIASFCSSIIQYTDAIISLIESDKLIAIPPILRSILEAYVELLNLCKHEDYIFVLTSNHLRQKIKKFEVTFKEPNNPFLQHTMEYYDDIGSEIKKLRKQKNYLDQYTSSFGVDITKIKDRFDLAGIKDAYAGIYSQLCEDTHNEIIRVESRHLAQKENRTEFSIKANWDLEDISHYILTAIEILKSALINTFHHLNFNNRDDFLPKIEKNENLINTYFGEYNSKAQ